MQLVEQRRFLIFYITKVREEVSETEVWEWKQGGWKSREGFCGCWSSNYFVWKKQFQKTWKTLIQFTAFFPSCDWVHSFWLVWFCKSNYPLTPSEIFGFDLSCIKLPLSVVLCYLRVAWCGASLLFLYILTRHCFHCSWAPYVPEETRDPSWKYSLDKEYTCMGQELHYGSL